jgi:hypothetical protein
MRGGGARFGKGANGDVEPVPLGAVAVIHEDQRTLRPRLFQVRPGALFLGKNAGIGAVQNAAQLFPADAAPQQRLFEGPADGDHVIGKSGGDSLLHLRQRHGDAAGKSLRLGRHQLGRDVLHMQNDLGAKHLGNQRGEHQEIRQIVNVHHVELQPGMQARNLPEGQSGKNRPEQERRSEGLRRDSAQRLSVFSTDINTVNVDPVEDLVFALSLFHGTDHVIFEACARRRLGRPPHKRVLRINVTRDSTHPASKHKLPLDSSITRDASCHLPYLADVGSEKPCASCPTPAVSGRCESGLVLG